MDCLEIINRIAEKGGIIGCCARYYSNDTALAHEFIKECFEYCDKPTLTERWGIVLTNDIINYAAGKRGRKLARYDKELLN